MAESQKIEVEFRGRKVIGTPVGFKSASPLPPMVFDLEDGSTLLMQYVLAQCVRLDGEYLPNGEPVYLFRHGAIPTTTSPQHLKKQPKES